MSKAESKYFNTARRMDDALLSLLSEKDFQFISVKEICARAGVNRSTFYLHYETIGDLLAECIEVISKEFSETFHGADLKNIGQCSLRELIFTTPSYLYPYLQFVNDHKTVFQATFLQPEVLRAEQTFQQMFVRVFNPIMERFHFPEPDRKYILTYYISGLQGIVREWLKQDCQEDVAHIAELMMNCIIPDGTGLFTRKELGELLREGSQEFI